MDAGRTKKASDCDAFCDEYILKRKDNIKSAEEYAFLLGYYSHLITDAVFQAMIRDENRVRATWMRIKSDDKWGIASVGMDESWDSVKRLIPKKDRMREIYAMEAEYLCEHPNSGYLTEILPLKTFRDYIDYLPQGCVVRKIGVMGYLPEPDKSLNKFISMSRDEYAEFVKGSRPWSRRWRHHYISDSYLVANFDKLIKYHLLHLMTYIKSAIKTTDQ